MLSCCKFIALVICPYAIVLIARAAVTMKRAVAESGSDGRKRDLIDRSVMIDALSADFTVCRWQNSCYNVDT